MWTTAAALKNRAYSCSGSSIWPLLHFFDDKFLLQANPALISQLAFLLLLLLVVLVPASNLLYIHTPENGEMIKEHKKKKKKLDEEAKEKGGKNQTPKNTTPLSHKLKKEIKMK